MTTRMLVEFTLIVLLVFCLPMICLYIYRKYKDWKLKKAEERQLQGKFLVTMAGVGLGSRTQIMAYNYKTKATFVEPTEERTTERR